MVLPPPRGKSPAKTNLNSPARRNPSLAPVSSPVRGTIVEPRSASVAPSVVRKLNFSTGNLDQSPIAPSPHKNGLSSTKIGTGKLGKAPVIAPLKRPFQNVPNDEDENEDDTPDQVEIEEAADGSNFEESYQLNGLDDDIPDEEDGVEALEAPIQEEESELAPISVKPVKSVRGRPKQIVHEAPADEGDETVPGSVPVAKKARGRPKRANAAIEEEHDSDKRQTKRPRRSDASEVVQHAKSKPQRVAPVATKPKPKAGSKKSRLSIVAESDSPQVQRGPPMPRRKDLVIVRRETPMEGGQAFKQTRSGRASMRPLAYWLGEKAEYSDDDDVENDKPRFLSRSIKEVIRVEEVPVSKPKKWKNKSSKKQTIVESEDEDLAEPWEAEPGRLYGHVVSWDPEDPAGSHGDEREDEIALSSAAINTRDVADASFKFAKTLTLPFFGSGVVDLPPGAIKRQKNARKMQMAFFVFTGRVKAIVNGNEFRISKGGMFQVPRGQSSIMLCISLLTKYRKFI